MNRTTSADGTVLAYEIAGDGAPLVYVTGACCHRRFPLSSTTSSSSPRSSAPSATTAGAVGTPQTRRRGAWSGKSMTSTR